MPEQSESGEIILQRGLILADPLTCEVLPHGRTVISRDRLVEVNGPDDYQSTAMRGIDCSGCLIMPGLVNAHTHAAMSLLRGIADDLPLDRWLNDYIFPVEAKHVDPDFVLQGTLLSAVEMALGGITTYADGYFHMEQAAAAALQVGLRSVVAQGILDVPTPDAPTPGSWKDRAERFLADCPRDSLITPALFCHSAYLCGPDTLRAAGELTRQHNTLLFSHVAETRAEVEEVKRGYGKGPVELLNDVGVLGPDFVAVHVSHVSDRDREILAETGTGTVHCPESNMKLAAGPASVKELLDVGVRVAIGTDGPASNNNLDLLEEIRSAAFLAKLVYNDPVSLDAKSLIRMATVDGAAVLGMDDRIGSLEKGKLADLIVLDLDRPHLTPLYDPVSHLVYAARGSDVRDVIVNGRIVVRDKEIVTVNEKDIKARVREIAAKIAEDVGLERNYANAFSNK